MTKPPRVLVLADTFPSRLRPWHGSYNRRQFECLAKLCPVTAIAPQPWPTALRSKERRLLARHVDHVLPDLPIYHPIFFYLPVIGRLGTWRGLARAARKALAMMPEREFDILVATFAYPHGLAAKRLAEEMEIPYVIKARGSDLHSLPHAGHRRKLAAEAIRGAARVIAVAPNLAEIAVDLGADPARVDVLLNGIDAERFKVIDRDEARARVDLRPEQKLAVSVGNLLPVKGVDVLCDAAQALDLEQLDAVIVFAGSGPMADTVKARKHDRLRLVGQLDREAVALWLNAADMLILASRNEGCPNVVLEALACGTPVVASRVGAVPELLDDACGLMAPPNDPKALADAIRRVWSRDWDRAAIRKRVENRSWAENARAFRDLLKKAF
jgi:glycosyltransferase involved in cell wall biosynthesis